MRSAFAATVLMAACLVASVASAQSDKKSATFESLSAQGVVGNVTLNPMQSGEVQIHASLRNLEPNTEYDVLVYDQNSSCTVGSNAVQIFTFTSNQAGIITWNQRVSLALQTIQSIGIREEPTQTQVACASVPQ
jgi:hypothetical protein